MVGPHTRMIQDVVGWATHDAEKFLAEPANRKLDLYGFAMPRDTSLLPPIEKYLKKPEACFSGSDSQSVNDRNVAALARFYRGLPPEAKGDAADCGK